VVVALADLLSCLNQLLEPARYRDYCPNGLQVEGRAQVGKLLSGVSACDDLITAAVECQADAILVHHGYFWKGENPCLVGMKRRRLARLLQHDISLLAYHLPLDEHPQLGNNARLGVALGLQVSGPLDSGDSSGVGLQGKLSSALTGSQFAEHIAAVLGRRPLHIPAQRAISRVGWCSGAGQEFIEQAVSLGLDAYITGEVSEQTVHIARECNIHFYAAGHHATERYGVQAVGEYLGKNLALEHQFVDVDNPA
jgi:dinuclear metal center YbgI/SA1388 family protein